MEKQVKIGIVVVYLMNQDDDGLLKLHLNKICDNTPQNFTIYASANRLHKHLKDILSENNQVRICNIPDTNLRVTYENSYYLERLIRIAIDDDCTHIAIFHPDSFPVQYDWFNILTSQMTHGMVLASIVSDENNNNKPHSSFIFFGRDFYLKYSPNLLPDKDTMKRVDYKKYSKANNVIFETGIGYGYCMYMNNLHYLKLLQSNRNLIHSNLAIIYGDLIFHLNANVMPHKVFNNIYNKPAGRLFKHLNTMISYLIPLRFIMQFKSFIIKKFISPYEHKENKNKLNEIKSLLVSDTKQIINYLRGDKLPVS